MTERHLPDWVALILINFASFGSVAALILLSMAADNFLSNLS